jgi:hypothetical protein
MKNWYKALPGVSRQKIDEMLGEQAAKVSIRERDSGLWLHDPDSDASDYVYLFGGDLVRRVA